MLAPRTGRDAGTVAHAHGGAISVSAPQNGRTARSHGRIASFVLLVARSAHAVPIEIDLPRQPLTDSIRTLAQRARVTIAVERGLINGRMSPPVKGRFEPRLALEKLLAGSGLMIVSQPDSWMLVRPAPPISPEAPVAPRDYGSRVSRRLIPTTEPRPCRAA